jgi:hypothetical protein
VDAFLTARGYKPEGADVRPRQEGDVRLKPAATASHGAATAASPLGVPSGFNRTSDDEDTAPVPFVCEDDVRAALRADRKIVVSGKTIITPAARDLGEAARVFVESEWPR